MASSTDFRVLIRTLELINAERARLGAPALTLSTQLNQAAEEHCRDMDETGYLGPKSPTGVDVSERARRAGYSGRTDALVAQGPSSPSEAVAFFMQSHRADLLSAAYLHLGVGMINEMWTLVLAAPPSESMKEASDVTGRVLELINRERHKAGLAGLSLSQPLAAAAQEHSAEMARRDFFGTTTPDGATLSSRVQRAGFGGRSVACLARGPISPDEAVSTWLGSAGNRTNLLHPDVRHLGVAVHSGRWTLILGT